MLGTSDFNSGNYINNLLKMTDYYGGFSLRNCTRNLKLMAEGFKIPKVRKTGTTIAGCVFKEGIVLGADTRATEDTIVADKNCSKIHKLSKTIYCCGAGTAADTEMVTRLIAGNLELLHLRQNRPPRVTAANTMLKQHLYKYQGHIGAALVLGGVDEYGPHLYSIHPYGSTDQLPYIAMGSGSLAAMSVMESHYKSDINKVDAVQLIRNAITAGILNDLGSGSNIDICIIHGSGVEYIRPYEIVAKRGVRQGNYTYRPGTTVVVKTQIEKIGEDILGTEVEEYSDSEETPEAVELMVH